ncbi:MAG TPA: energy-coupling factor transporter transmembrane component T [Pirellulales bacterium]|jgi:cobalt/nickel transport system permease protein|nr:energy-coupling factor transporter transmembrane component T [Pirellulales bacterium]
MTGLHEPLDRYSRNASATWLHRLDARIKLLAALAAVVVFSFTPPTFWPAPAGVSISLVHVFGAIALCVLLVWAGVPLGYAVKRLCIVVPLLTAMALSVPLGRGFDATSWSMMGQIVVRAALCVTTLLVLANTTSDERLLSAMARLGVPNLLVTTLRFMVRYQALVADELARMRRARLSRTFDARGNARWSAVAGLVGRVLVRSFERSERVHAAMLARGFDGTIRDSVEL